MSIRSAAADSDEPPHVFAYLRLLSAVSNVRTLSAPLMGTSVALSLPRETVAFRPEDRSDEDVLIDNPGYVPANIASR